MPVGCCRAYADGARHLGEGKAGRAVLGYQVERRLDQGLGQVTVMIGALRSFHVNIFYMKAALRAPIPAAEARQAASSAMTSFTTPASCCNVNGFGRKCMSPASRSRRWRKESSV